MSPGDLGVLGALDRLVTRSPAGTPTLLRDAEVSKVVGTKVWCTPVGESLQDVLIGPCLGATYRDVSTCPAGAHTHPLAPLPLGTRVLLLTGDHAPWVLRAQTP